MKILGIPIHEVLALLLLLGAAHFLIAQLTERTTGTLTKKTARKVGI